MLEGFEGRWKRHADDLRATWQARALAAATIPGRPHGFAKDKIGMCVISVLAHNFDDALEVLLRLHGFDGLAGAQLCSAAKVARTGEVMADMVSKWGTLVKNQGMFLNTDQMQNEFRAFADPLKLTDQERVEFFDAVKRWVVCDFRLDPNDHRERRFAAVN